MVGVGGGSSIDTAKAIALLSVAGGELREYKVPAVVTTALPVIAVPTTAGTGSEATRVAVVTDTASDEKMLLMGLGLLPRAALVDFTLTLTCPYRLTADSGLDSLCHAMEAYVSRRANAFSDLHALAALRIIPGNLRAVCSDLSDRAAREALMNAATHAGIAFSNASVTLIHGPNPNPKRDPKPELPDQRLLRTLIECFLTRALTLRGARPLPATGHPTMVRFAPPLPTPPCRRHVAPDRRALPRAARAEQRDAAAGGDALLNGGRWPTLRGVQPRYGLCTGAAWQPPLAMGATARCPRHVWLLRRRSGCLVLPRLPCITLLCLTSPYALVPCAQASDDEATACAALIEGLEALCAELKVPSPAAYGISWPKYEGLLGTMAKQALGSGSPNNNPIVPTAEQITEIYREIFGK